MTFKQQVKLKPGMICKLKNFNKVILVQLEKEHESKQGFWYKIIEITNLTNKGYLTLQVSKVGDILWDMYEDLTLLTDTDKIKLL